MIQVLLQFYHDLFINHVSTSIIVVYSYWRRNVPAPKRRYPNVACPSRWN